MARNLSNNVSMKKIITFLILFNGFAFLHSFAQTTCPCTGDIILSSQAQVDAFNCTEITGTLTIIGNDITNINGLISLTKINSSIFYSLLIENNPLLTNLDGLSSLKEINSGITISGNPSLQSINGFSSITTLLGALSITNNSALTSLNGFSHLTEILTFSGVNSVLEINNNPLLSNLDGFSSLKLISGDGAMVNIINNASLTNINGLSSLDSIAGIDRGTGIVIDSNPLLQNLDALSSLSFMGWGSSGTVVITNNATLQSVTGLSALTNLSGPPETLIITVTKNPQLQMCCSLLPLLDYIGSDKTRVTISENSGTCTLEDLLAPNTCNQAGKTIAATGQEISVSIFPVPTENELTIKLTGPAENNFRVSIKNNQGQLFYSDYPTQLELNTYQINTVSLSPGLYYLLISNDNGFKRAVSFIKK
jgi:hypothetical protein